MQNSLGYILFYEQRSKCRFHFRPLRVLPKQAEGRRSVGIGNKFPYKKET